MRKALATALLSALVALPAPALGQDNAAIDQYREKTPSAGGDKPTRGDAGGTGGEATDAPAAPLPPGSAEALRASGDGSGAAKLAEGTAPPPGGVDVVEPTGGSPGDSEDSDSGGGLGALLWVLLGGAVLAAVTFAVIRTRGGPDQPAGG